MEQITIGIDFGTPNTVVSYLSPTPMKFSVRGFKSTATATEILKFVRREVIRNFKGEQDTVISAVIAVPAEFKPKQIDELKKAGATAGLNVIRIVTAPMAAAFAASSELNADGKIMIVNFDENKLALTLLEIGGDSYKTLAHVSNKNLGGEIFDNALENYLLNLIGEDIGRDFSTYEKSGINYDSYWLMRGRLHSAAASAKETLNDSADVDIYLPSLFQFEGEMYNLDIHLTRAKFDELNEDTCAEIFAYIEEFIERVKVHAEDLSEIILAGDSYFIPYIRGEIERRFNRRTNMELEPNTLVAYGACLIAEHEIRGLENPDFSYDNKKFRVLEKLANTQKLLDALRVEAEEKIRALDRRKIDLENEYRQKNSFLESEYEKCQLKLAELNKKFETQEAQIERLANTQELLDEMLEDLAEQRRELDARRIALEREEGEKVALEKTRADLLQDYLDDANREIEALKHAAPSAETQEDVSLERTRADLLQDYLDDANKEIEALKARIEHAPPATDSQENVELEKTRADLLQEYLNDANEEIEALKQKIEHFTGTMETPPEIDAQEHVELEKTRADLLQDYLDDANKEIEALKVRLEHAERPSDSQENVELEKTRADLLQDYLDDANQEIESLKAKLEHVAPEIDAQENVEYEKTRADLLQDYLDEANREIEALKAEIAHLHEELAAAHNVDRNGV